MKNNLEEIIEILNTGELTMKESKELIQTYIKNQKLVKLETCERCEGEGQTNISCCGINIHGNDSDHCPDCNEHCGDESETCEDCNGSGETIQKNK